jgi:WD repeat-containing protein 35
MSRYAKSLINAKQTTAAIDFYIRAGLHIEAARLLLKYGDDLIKEDCDYLAVKMCYVFAGIQIEKSMNVEDDSPNAREHLLDGLIREDKQTAAILSLEIWRKAEAIHFLIAVSQKIQQRDFKSAVYIAGRLFDEYYDTVGEVRSAALLALCGMNSRFYGQCSRALTSLEHCDQLSEESQKNFE